MSVNPVDNRNPDILNTGRKGGRGRIAWRWSAEQMQAISGTLTLLTNIVMAWNTKRIQSLRDQNPDGFPDDIVARLAPIAHAHINMRGVSLPPR